MTLQTWGCVLFDARTVVPIVGKATNWMKITVIHVDFSLTEETP